MGVGKADKRRIKKADHGNTPAEKKRRKVLRSQKKKKQDSAKEKEGTADEAGEFWNASNERLVLQYHFEMIFFLKNWKFNFKHVFLKLPKIADFHDCVHDISTRI